MPQERNRFGRYYYRFPNGESTADVYNRLAIFEDGLVRGIRAVSRMESAAAVVEFDRGWRTEDEGLET